MPIYEYRCEQCGEIFEQVQKITEAPLKKCVLCGGNAHRIISKSTFILKGTGWYATDYASGDRKRGLSSEKTKAPSSSSSASTDTSTTPAEGTTPSSTSSKTDTEADSSPKTKKNSSDKSMVAA